jgi:hypothetical protein
MSNTADVNHKQLYNAAVAAIRRLYEDYRVPPEQTAQDLNDLADEIEDLKMSLRDNH